MNSPLVSVIVPAYNAEKYIRAAISSVLGQAYPRLEVIVVDDGSTDGTVAEVLRFGDRVSLLRQTNKGPAAARNLGAGVAKGEFLAFMDGDDLWVQGKTRAQVDYLQRHPEVGVVFGRIVRWYAGPDGKFAEAPVAPDVVAGDGIDAGESGWLYPQMLLDSVVWIVSSMIRREVWQELGGLDESLRIGEDYDFFIRASRGCRFAKLDQVVAIYRIHPTSTTQAVRGENLEYKVLQRALGRYGDTDPHGAAVDRRLLRNRIYWLCFNFGYGHFRRGVAGTAARAFLSALAHRPLRYKAWLFLGLSCLKALLSLARR